MISSRQAGLVLAITAVCGPANRASAGIIAPHRRISYELQSVERHTNALVRSE